MMMEISVISKKNETNFMNETKKNETNEAISKEVMSVGLLLDMFTGEWVSMGQHLPVAGTLGY